jgi:hypothetical protein
VAVVETAESRRYVVDREAVILPPEDLDGDAGDFEKRYGLIRINGPGLAEPWKPRPGLPWQTPPGLNDLGNEKERIGAAAKLAAFLVDKLRSIDTEDEPALHFTINPLDERGLFLWNGESTYILWGAAPGEETPGSLSAEEKWERLRKWSLTEKNRVVPRKDFWIITTKGLVHVGVKPSTSEAARVVPGTRDRSTVRAKASGHRGQSLSP